jgi:tetratricopeptide (TPR) repeat protein
VPTSTLLANLGLYFQEKGDLEQSLSTLKRALDKKVDELDTLNYLGVIYFYSGKKKMLLLSLKDCWRSIKHLIAPTPTG